MALGINEVLIVLPVCLVLGILVLVFAGVLIGGVARRMTRKGPPTPGNVDFWAQGAYGLWTGGEDSGQWPQAKARSALEDWYGATDRASFDAVIDDLREGTTGNPSWDQCRALDLLQIGVAAGYVTAADGKARIRAIAADLRDHYDSWEELAEAFEEGMHEWQDERGISDPQERGRVQRNLVTLRTYLWPRIDWNARL